MLQTAAKAWGYPGMESEASFDPLVGLLINACAAEIEKISREKNLSQFRLIEELARLLTPEAETRAVPAHAIALATPLKPREYITEDHQFILKVPGERPDRPFTELYFSPTGRFPVARAGVRFLAAHDRLYEIIENKYKDIAAHTFPGRHLPNATLFIGLQVGPTTTGGTAGGAVPQAAGPDELSFFFHSTNEFKKNFFYENLGEAVWHLNGQEIERKKGYASSVEEDSGLQELLFKKYRSNEKTGRSVNRFYKKQFITIGNLSSLQAGHGKIPEALLGSFDGDTLRELGKELVWLEVAFPEVVSHELFNDLLCFTNCFPVINRRQHELMYRLRQSLNIIPLKSRDYFFDIRQIHDAGGKSYHVHQTTGEEAPSGESVLLRNTGAGRFKTQEASEVLHYLLETLKDETASYAAVGPDQIAGTVHEINRLIGDLEEKVSGMSVRETTFYLVMRNGQKGRNLFVEYWSTAGAGANNIKPGTLLDALKSIDLEQKNAVLITTTAGGRDRLSDEEKLIAYKQALLSKERLVTAEDIRTFCFRQLGSRIRRVDIQKGLVTGENGKEGLVRTIDIVLTPNEEVYTSEKEWSFLLEDMLHKVQLNTAHTFPYRIVLNGSV